MISETAPRPATAAPPRERATLERPAFLVGAARSGTTLLKLMLDHHPEIEWIGEVHYIVDPLPPGRGFPAAAAYRAWLEGDRIFRMTGLAVDPGLDAPALIRSFFAQRQRATGKPIVGGTLHRRFERVLELWPEARFVHLLRDGRDVARSCIGMGWSGNTWHGAAGWVEAERRWDELCRRLDPARALEVRYEELVERPEQVLGRICEFLGARFHPAMLDYPRDSTYGAPDPSLIHQWRKAPPLDVRLAEARLGGLLADRGYPPSGLPPLRPGPLARLRLRAQDRLAVGRFRLERYGPLLWSGELLARRLGLRALHEPLRRKLQEIDRKHLK